jgi:hypothetical protein
MKDRLQLVTFNLNQLLNRVFAFVCVVSSTAYTESI